MLYVDECETQELASCDFSEAALVMEAARVADVIGKLVMTGADLSCWYERERVIDALLRAS